LLTVAGTVLVTTGLAAVLVPKSGTGVVHGFRYLVILVGLVAVAVLCWAAWRLSARPDDPGEAAGARSPATVGCVLAAVALLLAPAVASVSAVTSRLGPFDSPFQSASATAYNKDHFGPATAPAGLAAIGALQRGAPWLGAAQTSIVASPYIYATGQEMLPVGGYTGIEPVPSAAQVAKWIAAGKLHAALVATPVSSAAASYIDQHCQAVTTAPGTQFAWGLTTLKLYDCSPQDATP